MIYYAFTKNYTIIIEFKQLLPDLINKVVILKLLGNCFQIISNTGIDQFIAYL